MGSNLFKGRGNRTVVKPKVLSKDVFRNLRNPFKGNHIHIKKENFIFCFTLHYVIFENPWLLKRMHRTNSVVGVNALELLFTAT